MLKGKNAIITGCRKGIGRAIVESFAENGATIWAHARAYDESFIKDMENTSKKHGVAIHPVFFDVTNHDEMKAVIGEIKASKMPVDILVNNAGITQSASFQMTSNAVLRDQIETNFCSVFLLTQYISKLMIRNNAGSIINISSISGIVGHSGKSAYGASKAAVISMTKSAAVELGEYGIRVNCLAPGFIDTDMLKVIPEDIIGASLARTSLKRLGNPKDVADAAVFFASDLSRFITGQVLAVDGGLI